MEDEVHNDNFIRIEDNYEEYIQFVRLSFTEFYDIVEKIDKIIDENVFNNAVYTELSGLMRYSSKRVFPLLLAFFGQDDNFEDIYPEFMDIQLMVLFLFDKVQYEMDEVLLHWDLNKVIVDEDIMNLQSINYLLKLIITQLSLFVKVFDTKIQLVEGTIDETEFENKMIEIHDDMFI